MKVILNQEEIVTAPIDYLKARGIQTDLANPKPKRQRKPRARYNHPKKQSMAARILDEIERSGGMTTTQIRKTLFSWAYPDQVFDKKKNRGWWSVPLHGGMHSSWGDGLLKTFCRKQGKKWVRNEVDHEGHPWRVIDRKRRPNKGNTWTSSPYGNHIVMTYVPTIVKGIVP
jgi:hypothetical protein